jgi:hypothetical protein
MAQRPRSRSREPAQQGRSPGVDPPPASQEHPKGLLGRLGENADSIAKILGVIGTVVGGGFWVYHHFYSGDSKSRPKVAVSASVAGHVKANLVDYLKNLGRSTTGYTQTQLQTPGNYDSLRVRLVGLRGTTISVKWSILAVRGSEVVLLPPQPGGVHLQDQHVADIRPTADEDQRIASVWVPWPQSMGDYLARFELRQGREVLELTDSPKFSVPAYFVAPPRPFTVRASVSPAHDE